VHAGREADDQQAGVRVAERRDRGRVVVRVAVADLVEEGGQARAVAAIGVESCWMFDLDPLIPTFSRREKGRITFDDVPSP